MKIITNLRSFRIAMMPVLMALFFLSLSGLQAQITTYPYSEDFESGGGGWNASFPGPSGWTRGTPAKTVIIGASSGTKAWMTGMPTGNYAGNFNSWVTSPVFDFTNLVNPAMKIDVWWESEGGFDGAAIMVTIDSGSTWTRLGKYQDPNFWYNDDAILSTPCNQAQGWSGDVASNTGSGQYVSAETRLGFLAGEASVRFRVCFSSDGAVSMDGFAFDNVIIEDLPILNLGNDTVLCFQDTIILDAGCGPGCQFQWSSSPKDTNQILVVTKGNPYLVKVTTANGFHMSDTINITVSPTFVNLGPDKFICPGDSITVDAANPWATHIWQSTAFPGVSDTNQVLTTSVGGTYWVTVSDTLGCIKTDTIVLTVEQIPNVDLGNDTTICLGESVILDAGTSSLGATYLWSFGGSTTQSVQVTAGGTYDVVVTTAAGCEVRDTVVIGIALAPLVDLGSDRIECGTFTLNAFNTGATFLWSNNAQSQTITTSTGGTYWVQVVNQVGCPASDTVVITSGAVPVVDLGPNVLICNNVSVTLDAGNPGAQYLWSTLETTQSITTTTGGMYVVKVTNSDGCITRDTMFVTVSPLLLNLGPDFTMCEGDSVVLNAGTQGTSYQWSTNQTVPIIFITTGGVYSVSVDDVLGCTARDTVIVTGQTNFNVNFSLPDTAELYQTVQFTDLTPGNPTSWLWEFGDGLTSTLQNPTHQYQSINDFDVTLTVGDGICSSSSTKPMYIELFTGLEDDLVVDMRVYPNPSTGRFTVSLELEQPRPVELVLLDMRGQELFVKDLGTVFQHEEYIQIPNLAAGLYMFAIRMPEGPVYRKLIIQ